MLISYIFIIPQIWFFETSFVKSQILSLYRSCCGRRRVIWSSTRPLDRERVNYVVTRRRTDCVPPSLIPVPLQLSRVNWNPAPRGTCSMLSVLPMMSQWRVSCHFLADVGCVCHQLEIFLCLNFIGIQFLWAFAASHNTCCHCLFLIDRKHVSWVGHVVSM